MSEETTPSPYRILLSNDDGVLSPGLLALSQALREVAYVDVVAPDHNWSAAGHTKTMHKPLRAWPTTLADGTAALTSNGSPSDCVALALLGLIEHKPDLVVSGINLGANLGYDLTYSGTVAAAMEGVISGVPAIAASLDSYEVSDYGVAARFVAHLATRVLEARLEQPMLLNVNIPAVSADKIRGVQITRLGRRLYRDALVSRHDPRGRAYYWIGGEPPDGVPEEGTDIGSLVHGYISVTPILMDRTDYARQPLLAGWDLAVPAL
jgi:5'-nucleotidase